MRMRAGSLLVCAVFGIGDFGKLSKRKKNSIDLYNRTHDYSFTVPLKVIIKVWYSYASILRRCHETVCVMRGNATEEPMQKCARRDDTFANRKREEEGPRSFLADPRERLYIQSAYTHS